MRRKVIKRFWEVEGSFGSLRVESFVFQKGGVFHDRTKVYLNGILISDTLDTYREPESFDEWLEGAKAFFLSVFSPKLGKIISEDWGESFEFVSVDVE